MAKPKRPAKKKVSKHDISMSDVMRAATGTVFRDVQEHIIDQTYRTFSMPSDIKDSEIKKKTLTALEMLASLEPEDVFEGMLCAQIVGAHNSAMECLRIANLSGQTMEGREFGIRSAAKLQSVYVRLVEALDKHRGKGQQKVTVEHVNVGAGGQAIVGNFDNREQTNRKRAGSKRQPAAVENNPGEVIDLKAEKKVPVKRRKS